MFTIDYRDQISRIRSTLRQTTLSAFIIKHKYTLAIFLAATLVYSWISVYKHFNYQSNAFDLAIFTQTSWLISHFKEPYSTVRMIFEPADHFGPTYWLLSLGYRLFNSPLYLLLLQMISILAGGIPVWLMSRSVLKSETAANNLLVAYFFQIGIINAISFDFSTTALSVGFIAWAIYFWHRQQFGAYCLLLLLSLGCKEDIPILFGAFSLLMFARQQWKWAVVTLASSLIWFFGVIYIILPFVFHHPSEYLSHGSLLSGWADKELSLRQVFFQNLGFALLNPLGLLFSAANFTVRFLKTGPAYWGTEFHYGANIAAPLSISTAFGINYFITKTGIDRKTSAILLSLAIAAATLYTTRPVLAIVHPLPISRHTLDSVVAQIPTTSSVSAQSAVAPHLANRTDLYLFPRLGTRCQASSCPTVDYIILSQSVDAWPLTHDELNQQIKDLQHNPSYRLQTSTQGVYLFKKIAAPNIDQSLSQ